jgi:CcmD family protein
MMEHFGYLLAAYSIIFVAIFGYVWFIRARQKRVEDALRELTARINEIGSYASGERGGAARSSRP